MTNVFRPLRTLSGPALMILLVFQVGVLLVVWTMGDAFLIPGPEEVFSSWVWLVKNEALLHEALVSIQLNLEAIGLSAAIAIGLAYLTVLPFFQPIVSLLSKFRFFGLSGFLVALTILVGGGHTLKVAMLTFGMSTFFLTSMASVVSSIPKAEFDQARSLRMGPWRTVWEVVILGKADETFEVLRQNAAIGWMMLTMVEGLSRSEGGIGVIMRNQEQHFHMDRVFAIQLTIFVLGVGQDWLLSKIKNLVCPYVNMTLERK